MTNFIGGTQLASIRPAENSFKYSQHSAEAQGVELNRNFRIVVIGVGKKGNSTLNKLMEAGVPSVKCIAINTNAAHLRSSRADEKILIGQELAKGRGVHRDPRLGKAAVAESRQLVADFLSGIDIAFITAGLGGGTGAGAAPVIAEIAKSKGAATVGIVTMPFHNEKGRDKHAAASLNEMRKHCDTVVVIDDNRLTQLAPGVPARETFKIADQILASLIKGVVETISTPSLMNLDFTDFKNMVSRGGMAVVGVGESDSPNRAEEALRNALKTPLLDVDYAGATGALINVTGDDRMTIQEVNRIGEIVTEMMHGDAHILCGARVNPEQDGKLKVTLVMTGVDSPHRITNFDTVAPQLFNLDPYNEPEGRLDIELNLYQMDTDS